MTDSPQDPMFQTAFRPHQIHPTVYIAPGAIVVGDVSLAEGCSVWFHASLRGDSESIWVGAGTNIQEGTIFHADPGYPTIIGRDVTIGHGAIVHGATVGNRAVIGMRAVLLNGVRVGENCLVGAGALLTEGKEFPPNSLILGSPARVVRSLSEDEIARHGQMAENYRRRAEAFLAAGPQALNPQAILPAATAAQPKDFVGESLDTAPDAPIDMQRGQQIDPSDPIDIRQSKIDRQPGKDQRRTL
jgi:carbonic anhydrase/acetyltransferase-like protein (isoleucine patch superfamily)